MAVPWHHGDNVGMGGPEDPAGYHGAGTPLEASGCCYILEAASWTGSWCCEEL